MFIHDALSDLVVCGETDILAANIRINTNRITGEEVTGFQKQFQVMECVFYLVCHMMIKCMKWQ